MTGDKEFLLFFNFFSLRFEMAAYIKTDDLKFNKLQLVNLKLSFVKIVVIFKVHNLSKSSLRSSMHYHYIEIRYR